MITKHYPLSAVAIATTLALTACGGGSPADPVRLSSGLLVTANRDSAQDGTANQLATVSGNMISLARTDYNSAEPPPAVPNPPSDCVDMDTRPECNIPPGVFSTGGGIVFDNITVGWDPDGDIAISIKDALRVMIVDGDNEISFIELSTGDNDIETERGGLLGNFREYLLSRTVSNISGGSESSYGLIFTDRTRDRASVTDDDHLFFGIWLTGAFDQNGNVERIRYSPFAGGGDRVKAADFATLNSLAESATYRGKVAGLHTTWTARSAPDGSDDTYNVEAFYADAMLEAEFNPGTVGLSGQIDGIVSGGEMLEGSITLGDTPVTRHEFAYEYTVDPSDSPDQVSSGGPVDSSDHVTSGGRVLASEATGEIGGDSSFSGFWEGMFYNHVPDMAPDSFAGTFVVGNGHQTQYFAGGYAVNKE